MKTYAYRMLKQCSCLLGLPKLPLSAKGSAFDSYMILFKVSDLIGPVFTCSWWNSKPLVSESVWVEYVYKPSQSVIYRITRYNTKISYKPLLLNIPLSLPFTPLLFFLPYLLSSLPSFLPFFPLLIFWDKALPYDPSGPWTVYSRLSWTLWSFSLKIYLLTATLILITVICCLNS